MSFTNNFEVYYSTVGTQLYEQKYSTYLPFYFNYKGSSKFISIAFSMEARGYFLANETGVYTFDLNYVDDFAYVSFDAGNAFQCCQQNDTVGSLDEESENISRNWANTLQRDSSGQQITVELLAGKYYPLRLLYANLNNAGALKFGFQTPSSSTYNYDFDGYIFSSVKDLDTVCNDTIASTTSLWSNTYASTFKTNTFLTYTTNGKVTSKTVEKVIVQDPSITTETLFNTVTLTDITKITTASTKISTTNPDGQVIYIFSNKIEIPATYATSNSYTTYSGSKVTTYSTINEISTNSNSMIKETVIYEVKEPVLYTTINLYTPATIASATTYSTQYITTTGADSKETVSTIYYVGTPIVRGSTTVFTPATIASATTYSTQYITITGLNSAETVSTIYHVQTSIASVNSQLLNSTITVGIPNPFSIANINISTITYFETSFVAGSVNVASTFSTEELTINGDGGIQTVSTIYYFETPIKSLSIATSITKSLPIISTASYLLTSSTKFVTEAVTTSFVAGSVSRTTTYSTEYISTTGAGGEVSVSIIYHVETPYFTYITSADTPYNGSIVTTVSTGYLTVNGVNESSTVYTVYHVQTPIIRDSTTFDIAASVDITTTYSTGYSTLTGLDGKETISTVYYVKTPIRYGSTTQFRSYTGNEVSTYSTEFSTYIGLDGNKYIDTTYFVETPGPNSARPHYFNSTSDSTIKKTSGIFTTTATVSTSSIPFTTTHSPSRSISMEDITSIKTTDSSITSFTRLESTIASAESSTATSINNSNGGSSSVGTEASANDGTPTKQSPYSPSLSTTAYADASASASERTVSNPATAASSQKTTINPSPPIPFTTAQNLTGETTTKVPTVVSQTRTTSSYSLSSQNSSSTKAINTYYADSANDIKKHNKNITLMFFAVAFLTIF